MTEQASTPLAVSEDLSKTIQSAVDTNDIKAAVQAEILKQAADAAAAAVPAVPAAPVAAAAAAAAAADEEPAKPFTRTETIGGREFTFEAASELELERQVNNAYKVAAGLQTVEPKVDPNQAAIDAAAAEKAASDRAAALADLELRFKRGEISTQTYLEDSGAVKDYLEKQGVPLEELRASVDQSRQKSYEQAWADATTTFLALPGNTWPGGEKNKKLLGLKLQELGLIDATDKVAAISQAYAALRQDDMLFANETAAPAAPVAAPAPAAAPAAPVAAAPAAPAVVAPKAAPTSSTLFGASSGVSGGGSAAAPAAPAKIEIDKNAKPAEIMAAWKAQQLSEGKDLNAAFTEAFAGRR